MADSLSAKKDLEFDSSTKQQSGPLRRVVERESNSGGVSRKECEELGAERPGVMICKDGAGGLR